MLKNFLKLDWVLTAAVFLLITIGMLSLYSISLAGEAQNTDHFYKQLLAIFLGVVFMLALSFFDYRALIFYSTKFYFAGILILASVIFWGVKVRGTTGWIGLGGLHFQPVEIVKIIIIIFLAGLLSKKKIELSSTVKMISSVVLVLVPVALIISQPDFGSAMIILGIWGGMLFASGVNRKNLLLLLIIGIIFSSSGWFFLKDYQKNRLINFAKPMNDPKGSGYNVIQSLVAVGSGGLYGKGLGHGSQSQLNFLPEKHTDFIFAVIAEEMGFLGSLMVLGLFGIIIYRMKETASLARDNFGYLLVVGILTMFCLQIVINVGMNIGLFPVTGVPLPLLSYGGSAMTMMLAAFGITQSVYSKRIKIL